MHFSLPWVRLDAIIRFLYDFICNNVSGAAKKKNPRHSRLLTSFWRDAFRCWVEWVLAIALWARLAIGRCRLSERRRLRKKEQFSWDLRDVSRLTCSCFRITSSYVFFYLLRLEFSRWAHTFSVPSVRSFFPWHLLLSFSEELGEEQKKIILFVSLIPHWHISVLPLRQWHKTRISTIGENLFQHQ